MLSASFLLMMMRRQVLQSRALPALCEMRDCKGTIKAQPLAIAVL